MKEFEPDEKLIDGITIPVCVSQVEIKEWKAALNTHRVKWIVTGLIVGTALGIIIARL